MKNYEYSYQNSSSSYACGELGPLLVNILDRHRSNNKDLDLLELGSGSGILLDYLDKQGCNVTGVEESKSGIDVARNKFPHINFINKSLYGIKPSELQQTFDVVLAAEVIEHLFYPKQLIEVAKSCLKPNGILIITTPYHGYLKNLALSIFDAWDKHFSVDWDGGHIKFFSKKSLNTMITNQGLSCKQWHYKGRLPLLWKSMICVATKS